MVDPRVIHVMLAVEQLDEVCQASTIHTFWKIIRMTLEMNICVLP